jgi:hypothetical protein
MRPIYETAQDKQREDDVRRYLVSEYKSEYRKTPDLYAVDGLWYDPDGVLCAVVEIKTRNNAHNKYPTYMLSAQKWRKGLAIAENYNVPFMLIVKFINGIYGVRLKKDYEIKVGGRFDRGDSKDVEECIYVPLADFRKM